MNPNDCGSCLYKKSRDGFCYWWHTESNENCMWFEYTNDRKRREKK